MPAAGCAADARSRANTRTALDGRSPRERPASDGSYEIAAPAPQRNERVRVVRTLAPGSASPELSVTVDPRVALSARSLGPGRVRLSARIAHGPASSPPVPARWYVADGGSDVYQPRRHHLHPRAAGRGHLRERDRRPAGAALSHGASA